MGDAAMRIDRDSLVTWSTAMFRHASGPDQDAANIANFLAEADERGHPSHGTDQLPAYVRGFKEGHLQPSPQLQVVQRRGSLAVVDGDNALGHVVANFSMDLAIEIAKEHGIGLVSCRNSNHFGMAGHWPLKAIRANLIGYSTTNGPPVMAPWGGSVGAICNNPFAWGIPAGDETPILLDMALTSGARGKVRLANQRGELIPPGWALDKEGHPTTNAQAALDGVMLPLAEHKGSGIAIINEVLASAMSGSQFLTQITSVTMASTGVHMSWRIGHSFLVIDPSFLRPLDDFLRHVDEIIRQLRATPATPGTTGVQIPGAGGFRKADQAQREGIQFSAQSIAKLTEFGVKCGIPFPTSALIQKGPTQ